LVINYGYQAFLFGQFAFLQLCSHLLTLFIGPFYFPFTLFLDWVEALEVFEAFDAAEALESTLAFELKEYKLDLEPLKLEAFDTDFLSFGS
jgi:hypothetical protein